MTLALADLDLLTEVRRSLRPHYTAHEIGNSQVIRINRWNGYVREPVCLIASTPDGECLVSMSCGGLVQKATPREAVAYVMENEK